MKINITNGSERFNDLSLMCQNQERNCMLQVKCFGCVAALSLGSESVLSLEVIFQT